MGGDHSVPSKLSEKARQKSINITEEALRIGKLPIEDVADNMLKGLYTTDGRLK